MITTGAPPSRSSSVKARPAITGMPIVLKYPGVAMRYCAVGRLSSEAGGRSATLYSALARAPLSGTWLTAATDVTPGSAATRASSWR